MLPNKSCVVTIFHLNLPVLCGRKVEVGSVVQEMNMAIYDGNISSQNLSSKTAPNEKDAKT